MAVTAKVSSVSVPGVVTFAAVTVPPAFTLPAPTPTLVAVVPTVVATIRPPVMDDAALVPPSMMAVVCSRVKIAFVP